MHTLALQLAPVLAAEKSKVPFYVAGGVLVVWALTLSLGIGLRRPDFPGSVAAQRAIMAVTAVLALAAIATAVLTASAPVKSAAAATHTEALPPVPVVSAPTPSSSSSSAAQSPSAKSNSGEAKAPSGASAPVPSGAGTSLKLAADPSGALAYDTKQLSAKAGTVTITMANMSPLEHNVTIERAGKVLGATPTFKGGTRTLTLDLKPGKYKFYCSVPGHRQAGMEGTLNVS
ncbi:MAG TPA: plastocyanin/azurin family copper-binding protein [Solirubrobacteraceae bacterium]|nr:plastocyanin/azurin family copper-binding protein [Solirubrobacteraceae bacterium]